MDNPFFTALEGDGFDGSALAKQTNNVLMPFMHYLNNSIDALEHKEVSCTWKPLANTKYVLRPNLNIWRVTPISEIELLTERQGWYEILSEEDGALLGEHFSPDIEDTVIIGKGADRQSFTLGNEDYLVGQNRFEIYLPELEGLTKIQWCGYTLLIRPLSVALDNVSLVHVDGQACKVLEQKNQYIKLEGQVSSSSTLTINGQSANFSLLSSIDHEVLKNYPTQIEGCGFLVFTKNKPNVHPHKLESVTKALLAELSLDYLQCNGSSFNSDQWKLFFDKEGLTLEVSSNKQLNNDSKISCTRFPEIDLFIEPCKQEEKWIQLVEKDSVGDDTGKSELDYFFGDNQNIKILDATQRKHDDGFRVLKVRHEERQILLAQNSRTKKNWHSEYPTAQGKKFEIRVSVDTAQLKRQKEAINQLMSRPSSGHQPLIQLLQGRSNTNWCDAVPTPEDSIHWKVLTDPNFDGCDRQREFVGKALATPDFAILDGPPGTGKTTTILELIYQLVSEGKRVLLTASTHAAINNVLERVKESPTLSEEIFPLRIGNESNSVGVEEYQFDKQLESLQRVSGCEKASKQLMVDTSNLVCGTTIGILRLFNDKEIKLDRGEPPFDVMIIDECSKTTFQEFLVPARFAKRWVLVGDVRQLSPFTDREQIVANLDNLMLVPRKGKSPARTLSDATQQACFLLEELRPYKQAMLVPVSFGVICAINDELNSRRKVNELCRGLDNILLIVGDTGGNKTSNQIQNVSSITEEPWHLYGANLCFIDQEILGEVQPLIPDDMIVMHEGWSRTQQAMLHKRNGTTTKPFKIKKNDYTDTSEIHQNSLGRMLDTKWSEEVCWRLEREYWLRQSKNYQRKTGYLSEALQRLFPKSVLADGRIHVLKNIAFPSILEALSGDGLVRLKKDNPTTLNSGFSVDEKLQRHSTLIYQHRMHPDISEFPREQFYPEGVLADGSRTAADRAWSYKRYNSRNTWLDVCGKTHKNSNINEVDTVIRELKAFCGWVDQQEAINAKIYDVAILTFYKGQEKILREALQKLPGNKGRYARFQYKGCAIKLATVDYFQGQEADVVFLSMVNTRHDGFMDTPNRLNVAITRARYQMVIVGHHQYFSERSRTEELRNLAISCEVQADKYSGNRSRKPVKNGLK